MKFEIYYYVLLALALLIGLVFSLRRYAQNEEEPVCTVAVKLAKKREQHYVGRSYTAVYSLLFLTDGGEILEFHVPTKFEWDMLNEGDFGNLTYQGTHFRKFERTHVNPPQ